MVYQDECADDGFITHRTALIPICISVKLGYGRARICEKRTDRNSFAIGFITTCLTQDIAFANLGVRARVHNPRIRRTICVAEFPAGKICVCQ